MPGLCLILILRWTARPPRYRVDVDAWQRGTDRDGQPMCHLRGYLDFAINLIKTCFEPIELACSQQKLSLHSLWYCSRPSACNKIRPFEEGAEHSRGPLDAWSAEAVLRASDEQTRHTGG
jgi:hypothetical protein